MTQQCATALLGQRSSQCHFLHCHECHTNDVLEELLLSARDEINSLDTGTLERNNRQVNTGERPQPQKGKVEAGVCLAMGSFMAVL